MAVWAPVSTWEGRYEVSDTGEIRSLWRASKKLNVPKLLKQKLDRYGYPTVSLRHKGRKKTYTVHRLVATAFLKNEGNLPQVNHKDGNKINNRVENLEWCTASQNTQHAHNLGLISKKNISEGQRRRYQSAEQREISRINAKRMWADPVVTNRLKEARKKRRNED